MEKYFHYPARLSFLSGCMFGVCMAAFGYTVTGVDGALFRLSVTIFLISLPIWLGALYFHRRTTRAFYLYIVNSLAFGFAALITLALMIAFDQTGSWSSNPVFILLAVAASCVIGFVSHRETAERLHNATPYDLGKARWFADQLESQKPKVAKTNQAWTTAARWGVAFTPLLGQLLAKDINAAHFPIEFMLFAWAFLMCLGAGRQWAIAGRVRQVEAEHHAILQAHVRGAPNPRM